MPTLKKRHRAILQALARYGGSASTAEIARLTNLNTNGVSQSLGALFEFVEMGPPAKGASQTWRLIKTIPPWPEKDADNPTPHKDTIYS